MYINATQYINGEMVMNVSISTIRDNLADALNRVAYGGERVILERRGKPVAVLVSLEDLQLLEEMENQADIRAARKALKEKSGITLEEYRQKHGI
jgi:prevent-host-death family protein